MLEKFFSIYTDFIVTFLTVYVLKFDFRYLYVREAMGVELQNISISQTVRLGEETTFSELDKNTKY